ncbi:Sporulation kinase A [bacterium HR30]|nr:Sporulation kinase A [bacterium HR30]
MAFQNLPSLVAAIAAGFLAVLVASQRRDTESRAFVLLTTLIACWNVYFFILGLGSCDERSQALLRALATGVALLPAAVIGFLVVPRHTRTRVWRCTAFVSFGMSTVVVLANPFGLVVRGLEKYAWGCHSLPGPLYHVHTANAVLAGIAAIALCISDLRHAASPRDRLVARFWLISAAVGVPSAIINLLPAYGVPIYPLGNLGSALWAAIIAYAVVRHRLLDVEVWISRLGTVAAAGMVTIVPAYVLLVLLQIQAFGAAHVDLSMAILLSLVVVAAIFPILQRKLEKKFAERAFPYKIEQQSSLDMLRRAVLREQDLGRLVDVVAKGLHAVFHPPTIAIFTRQPEAAALRLAHHLGEPPAESSFPFTSPLVAELEDATLSLLQSELLESKRDRGREVGKLMETLGWTVCVPVKTSRQLSGFLALGLKEGRDWYMLTELEALERLAEELALALDNIQLHQQAALARQTLERIERLSAIGTMVAGIVHEVRNPLVAFSTFMQLARQQKASPELIEASAPVILGELDRVQRLLDELLRTTRGNPPKFGEVDLGQCVRDVAALLKPPAKQAHVVLEPKFLSDSVTVFADADRVRQVLFNLGMNAIEAAPEGTTVTITVARASKNGRMYGEVSVRDTGPGLPQELREKVFQPFFTTKADGTGLGLALCLQITEEHGGYLDIRDPQGPGIIFAVGFPEFIPEVHAPLVDDPRKDELQLTPEEEAHIRALVGNIKLPPEVLRLVRQTRIKKS